MNRGCLPVSLYSFLQEPPSFKQDKWLQFWHIPNKSSNTKSRYRSFKVRWSSKLLTISQDTSNTGHPLSVCVCLRCINTPGHVVLGRGAGTNEPRRRSYTTGLPMPGLQTGPSDLLFLHKGMLHRCMLWGTTPSAQPWLRSAAAA